MVQEKLEQQRQPYLGSVATDEVVHGLLLGQLADRWQHSKGVTA